MLKFGSRFPQKHIVHLCTLASCIFVIVTQKTATIQRFLMPDLLLGYDIAIYKTCIFVSQQNNATM